MASGDLKSNYYKPNEQLFDAGLANDWMSKHCLDCIVGFKSDPEASLDETEMTMADTIERFNHATEEVKTAYERFNLGRAKLKSELRNDVVAVAAAGEKMRNDLLRVSELIRTVELQLNSDSFVAAIQNTERLATALQAISAIGPSKVTLAMISPNQDTKA